MTITPLGAASPAGADFAEPQRNRPTAHVRVQMNVYEVTGEALTTLKPMDLKALEALVAEARNRKPSDALKDGARLISSPAFTLPVSDSVDAKSSRATVGQAMYIDKGAAKVVPPLSLGNTGQAGADGQGEKLEEIVVGVTVDARAWQDARTQKILLETQLRLSSFEGFTQVNLTQSDQDGQYVMIPLLKTIVNEGVSLLNNGETKILAWQENVTGVFSDFGRTLVVVTVTPTLIQSPK